MSLHALKKSGYYKAAYVADKSWKRDLHIFDYSDRR